jgi:lambda family phage portal protein
MTSIQQGAERALAMASGSRQPSQSRYIVQPAWGNRHFEASETTRLNEAHWQMADDQSVNIWLASQLPIIRQRAIYEARNNGMVRGMIGTHADDVVGPDGPTLQVQSDDDAYSEALERVWRDWFAAPTPRPNVSGTSVLKMWIRNLWKCGEFLARIATDPNAEGPVKMRILPTHVRRLVNPATAAGDPYVVMGIRFNQLGRPAQYYISDAPISGQGYSINAVPYPADLVIHEFLMDEEEDQARGIPLLNTGLTPAAELRDYDAAVQHASRRAAENNGMMYSDHADAQFWDSPEETTLEPGSIPMAPPGWKPFAFPATQPAAQYPDFRAERMRELGRPVGMPLLIIRLDASKHNYSSARLDTQCYRRATNGIQCWLSGTDRSVGTLNRLVDLVGAEARFTVRALRQRPKEVTYHWTWPAMPHVDPQKEANAEETSLKNRTATLEDALAARGKTLDGHIAQLQRIQKKFVDAKLPMPEWLVDAKQAAAAAASGRQNNPTTIPVDEEEEVAADA